MKHQWERVVVLLRQKVKPPNFDSIFSAFSRLGLSSTATAVALPE